MTAFLEGGRDKYATGIQIILLNPIFSDARRLDLRRFFGDGRSFKTGMIRADYDE